jgi:Flp pilus assembly protein TadG
MRLRDDRGQVLVLTVIMLVGLIGIVGLALDVGTIYFTKAKLVRAADAAALAAAAELPDSTEASGAAQDYVAENEPTADLELPLGFPIDGQVRANVSMRARLHFLPIIPGISSLLEGGASYRVRATAVAGTSGVPLDVVFVVDDTTSMADGCNPEQTNGSCPIKQARDAANVLLDMLKLESFGPKAALVPFRDCYNGDGSTGCVRWDEIVDLTANEGTLEAGIADLRADGGSATNICRGLEEGNTRLHGAGSRPGARKIAVLLTDADNSQPLIPLGGTCQGVGDSPNEQINDLDRRTYVDVAQPMKAAGVEIFVVGYGVVGNPDNAKCNPNQVGAPEEANRTNPTSDPFDRNLAKCIASSSKKKNDHYFEAPDPESLPDIFRAIVHTLRMTLVE